MLWLNVRLLISFLLHVGHLTGVCRGRWKGVIIVHMVRIFFFLFFSCYTYSVVWMVCRVIHLFLALQYRCVRLVRSSPLLVFLDAFWKTFGTIIACPLPVRWSRWCHGSH